ncbi:MAG: hypothetical protein JWO30_1136 [Fibrobacteres bacterium]|nr:hypothetical protein [Fibrobacterota bacterium]
MVYLKRFMLLIIIVLIGVFTVQNQVYLGQKVELVFIKSHGTLILGIWLIIAFLVGALLFLIIDLPRTLALKRRVRRNSQEIARLQYEVNRLQAASSGAPQPPPPQPDLEKRLGL